MGYELSIDDGKGIAEIRFSGALAHDEHVKARAKLLEACEARKIRRILVDARELSGPPPSAVELFAFGESWAELARATPVRIAGVMPQDAATRKWWEFGETVTLNRGFRTAAFEDIGQARAWLLA